MSFAELRFWEYLLAGLAVVQLLRWLVVRGDDRRAAWFDRASLMALGVVPRAAEVAVASNQIRSR